MGAPERPTSASYSMPRVKVYRLSDDGKWDDQGTGHVTIEYRERSEDMGLFVLDEDDTETLLVHRICTDDIYRKQDDTIISWRDPEYSSDLALSFQEPAGCMHVWEQIGNVRRNLHFNHMNNESLHGMGCELRELPGVELSTLPLILKRVKVYRLSDDGKWDDQGTGHVTIEYRERSEDMGLFVLDEDDTETLLVHRICTDDIYRKQDDTIISWRDPEYSSDLALSFQEPAGCMHVWEQIGNVRRNLHFNHMNNESLHGMGCELRELPGVELSTLPLILKIVGEGGIADQTRLIELLANDQNFFRKLMDVFKICEDLEDRDGLHLIYKIVKGIVMLNSAQMFEKIFGDDLFMDIIGSLEYDPEIPNAQHHREFLKEHVVFKEEIPIKNPLVLSKIHQSYRIGYLKDIILPRALDESIVANLNSIIHSNNSTVVSLLKDDNTFFQELFARLQSSATSAESKKNLVHFLHEFCSLSKSLQMAQQIRLFRDLISEGIFDIITDTLQSSDKRLVLTGTDILILFLNQDSNLLRNYIVHQEGFQLLALLIKGMVTDFEEHMHCQFLEILRSLLDSYTLSGFQRDKIIDIFYEKHLAELIDVIVSSCPLDGGVPLLQKVIASGEEGESGHVTRPEILLSICELLCFCVLHHPYRIKCDFLLNNFIEKILFLTRRRENYLVVAAVRFVRTILSRQDEHVVNHFVKNNLLKSIVEAFVANGNRYNLLNSAVLDLFEYIRKDNLKSLLKYLVDSFWDRLVNFEGFSSVHSLKVKYDQSLEISERKDTTNIVESRKRVDERSLEKEEEDYFNENSDEEGTASARTPSTHKQAGPCSPNKDPATHPPSTRSNGPVDYLDDDEDYRPPAPPRRQYETPEDEGIFEFESIKLKRRLSSKDIGPDLTKKRRLGKNSKSMFTALCSTLSQAVLPSKKTAETLGSLPPCSLHVEKILEVDKHRKEHVGPGSCPGDENSAGTHNYEEKVASDSSIASEHLPNGVENEQMSMDEGALIPPEMVVNGA